jgi:hypothetical protein
MNRASGQQQGGGDQARQCLAEPIFMITSLFIDLRRAPAAL